MTEKIDQAILLAAGFGTRLRPLTLTTPKPLLPLNGTLLIEHQLRYLAKYGFKKIAINLHHLGEKIGSHVGDGSKFGVHVKYSNEAEILGTGGGAKKAAELLEKKPILLLNCDALIDVELDKFIQAHLQKKPSATMVLKKLSQEDNFNPVDIDQDGYIKGFGNGKYFFTGLQILEQELINLLPPAGKASCLIKDGYNKLLSSDKKISSFIHYGYFNDLGTPERYSKAKKDIEDGKIKVR